MSRPPSLMLADDKLEELIEQFNTLDADGNGFISVDEIGHALEVVGHRLPKYQIRDLIKEFDTNIKDGKIDIEEFKMMFAKLEDVRNLGRKFKKQVKESVGVKHIAGTNDASSEGTTHSVKANELSGFADWINKCLSGDPDCSAYLPLNPATGDLYQKTQDGIILCKMINWSVPETVDERAINKTKLDVYRKTENLLLAINSARAIGCSVVNIGAGDLLEGKPHLVLGLLWQIIRIGLLSDINIAHHPGLILLLEEGECLEDLFKLSPEQILLRWVNYHLRNSGCDRQISNFTSDISDSVAYFHLLSQIAPAEKEISTVGVHTRDLTQRAELMLQEADKIDCRTFVGPSEVVKGNYKLNLAFVANLFNSYPALEKPDDAEIEFVQETREERTYRNWMNSMGVSPFVNRLYNDLSSGLVIFQLYDIIQNGIVDWNKVHQKFPALRRVFLMIENCNYAVDLGKAIHLSLVGVGGKDIYDGNETLTLALVWQLMRAYTLSILKELTNSHEPVMDQDIIQWANQKLASAGKSSKVESFKDHSLADGRVFIDLIDAIAPNSIKYDLVRASDGDEDRLANAKYAISMGRKIGARIYALPEDIVEVKPKMILTVFACLMTRDMQKKGN